MKPPKFSAIMMSLVLISLMFVSCKSTSSSTLTPEALRPYMEPTIVGNSHNPSYSAPGKFLAGATIFSIQEGDYTVGVYMAYPVQINGAPDSAHGPYPLVIFSPGLVGKGWDYHFLLSHLASYGFVVISSTPRGEMGQEFWAGAATRPLDVKLVMDYAEKLTATDGTLAGLIDTKRTAIAGHSSGGWTALIGAGAQMDLGWCAANQTRVSNNSLSNCIEFVPHQQEIATMLGLESVPTGMWPPRTDPRIVAAVAMAPDGDIWGAEFDGVAAIKVPTLIMTGLIDDVNKPSICALPIYEHLGSPKKTLIQFAGEGHYVFVGWGSLENINLLKHFVTAFMLTELKGDTEAAKALLSENVSFPTITFDATVSSNK